MKRFRLMNRHPSRENSQGSFRYRFIAGMVLCSLVMWQAWGQDGSAAGEKSWKELRESFNHQQALLRDPIKVLQSKYEAQLQALLSEVGKRGDLELALAVKAELKNYAAGNSVRAGDGFPQLARLQEIYAVALSEQTVRMNEKLRVVMEKYEAELGAVQKRLTQEGNLEEAVAVKGELERLNGLAVKIGRATASGDVAPADATSRKPFQNSLGMRFVPIPVETGPTSRSRILINIWETRLQDWLEFREATGASGRQPGTEVEGRHPVTNVNSEEAASFCEWLTERERKSGLIGLNDRYRLPFDHEWSCAVGLGRRENPEKGALDKSGSNDGSFPWGRKWPPPDGTGNFGLRDQYDRTAPVGSFPSNELGVHDLAGNVREICPDQAVGGGHILRGGSWSMSSEGKFRSALRVGIRPGKKFGDVGFRCVLEVSSR